MGIRGLTTYLERFPENFSTYELHNTYLVIDGDNFINHCHRGSGLNVYFGGEYLDFTVCVFIFLKQLRKCRIKPIFVFDGCHDVDGSKKETLINRNLDRIKSLSKFLQQAHLSEDADNLSFVPDLLPRSTNQVFLDVLRRYKVPHLSCEREADRHTAELAIYLDCPVLSNDSDFYLFQSPDGGNYRFIAQKTLSQQCHKLPSRCAACNYNQFSSCYAFSCSVFSPQQSVLKQIAPPLLPLLAVLIGNDVISSVKLPPSIETSMRNRSSTTENMSYSSRKIHAIIQWTTTFSTSNYEEAIFAVLSQCDQQNLLDVAKLMGQCASGYILHPSKMGPIMAAILGVNADKDVSKCESHIGIGTENHVLGAKETDLNRAVYILMTALSPNAPIDSTLYLHPHWPGLLVQKFNQGSLSIHLMDSIYVHGGSVLSIGFEDLQLINSINSVTEPLRKFQMGLLTKLENDTDGNSNLCCWTNGKPMETSRMGLKMNSSLIDFNPIPFYSSMSSIQTFRTVFHQHLQLNLYEDDVITNDLQAIACILVFWFRNSQYKNNDYHLYPTYSSVALVFVTCALLTQSGLLQHHSDDQSAMERPTAELCETYLTMGNKCKQHCGRTSSFSIQLVHRFNELQLVYLELHRCCELLDVLLLHQKTDPQSVDSHSPSQHWLQFWPSWVLFPSGRLFFWFAQALECYEPSDRQSALSDYWIPIFCQASPSMNSSASKIAHLADSIFKVVHRMLR